MIVNNLKENIKDFMKVNIKNKKELVCFFDTVGCYEYNSLYNNSPKLYVLSIDTNNNLVGLNFGATLGDIKIFNKEHNLEQVEFPKGFEDVMAFFSIEGKHQIILECEDIIAYINPFEDEKPQMNLKCGNVPTFLHSSKNKPIIEKIKSIIIDTINNKYQLITSNNNVLNIKNNYIFLY